MGVWEAAEKIGNLRSTKRQDDDAVSIYLNKKSVLKFDYCHDRLVT